jgi:F-type H+-transporting ATPase subunit epsilon
MAFQCVVVTPEQQLLDESITQAIVPGHDGLVGILTDRAPLLMKIGIGPLRIDRAGGSRSYYFIDGGVAQMKANKLTILTNHATPASEIDAEAARAEYAEAAARRATDPKSAADREHQLARARAMQDVAGKK